MSTSKVTKTKAHEADQVASSKGSSLERMLAVLDLFSEEAPVWSVDELSAALDYTRSTGYRYAKELTDAGLLFQVNKTRYTLGARIIQWDRQLRVSDPMVRAAQALEPALPALAEHQVWLFCRLFKDAVICVHQSGELNSPVSYSRGSPRPLFMGATSKAILAYLPTRQHMRLFVEKPQEIQQSNLGATWDEFRKSLQDIRRDGYAISIAEVDKGVFGVAAPVFDAEGRIAGSITCVRAIGAHDPRELPGEADAVVQMGSELSQQMARFAAVSPASR